MTTPAPAPAAKTLTVEETRQIVAEALEENNPPSNLYGRCSDYTRSGILNDYEKYFGGRDSVNKFAAAVSRYHGLGVNFIEFMRDQISSYYHKWKPMGPMSKIYAEIGFDLGKCRVQTETMRVRGLYPKETTPPGGPLFEEFPIMPDLALALQNTGPLLDYIASQLNRIVRMGPEDEANPAMRQIIHGTFIEDNGVYGDFLQLAQQYHRHQASMNRQRKRKHGTIIRPSIDPSIIPPNDDDDGEEDEEPPLKRRKMLTIKSL